jgi:TPR repeat protein
MMLKRGLLCSALILCVLISVQTVFAESDAEKCKSDFQDGDFVISFPHCLIAANDGNANAQYNLAQLYEKGKGTEKSISEAVNWYRKAAEQGVLAAQTYLGLSYYSGPGEMIGVMKDYAEAYKWLIKSAEQGDTYSQYVIGSMYARGEGVGKDYVEAVKWYKKAAEYGQVDAQNNLGVAYSDGTGVDKSISLAVKWFALAGRNGDDIAKKNYEIFNKKLDDNYKSFVNDAVSAFRVKPVKMTKQEETEWLKTYRKAFASAKTSNDLLKVGMVYLDDDPEGLVAKSTPILMKLQREEAKKEEAEAKKQQAAIKKKQQKFQAKIKAGDDTHCGMIIEVKKPVVKIQTMVGGKWFKITQLYPKGEAGCSFYNGEYVEP